MIKMSDDEVLRILYDKHMITLDDLMTSDTEVIMKNQLAQVHKHKISQLKDGRYITYVSDNTTMSGQKQIRARTKSELYKTLCQHYGIIAANLTVHDLFKRWIKYKQDFVGAKNKGLSQSSITRYDRDYHKFFDKTKIDNMPLSRVNAVVINEALRDIITSHTGVNNDSMYVSQLGSLLCVFRPMFEYAVTAEIILKNPFLHVDTDLLYSLCTPNPQKGDDERALTRPEIHDLLMQVHAMQESTHNRLYMPNYAIELACYTGMRVGEIAALKWSDIKKDKHGRLCIFIDHSEKRIDIKGKKSRIEIGEPKNRKHRHFPVTKDISDLLERIKAVDSKHHDFIFCNAKGKRYTGHDISCAARRRGTEAGITDTKVSIHCIRRTVCSLLNQTMTRKEVSAILGHTEEVDSINYDTDTSTFDDKIASLENLSYSVIVFGEKGKTLEPHKINVSSASM